VYAVIEVGGKQFMVQKGARFSASGFNKIKDGASVDIKKALLVKEGNTIHVGTPHLKGASVSCVVLRHRKADKVVAFKYKRRKSSKKKTGSRAQVVDLEVKEITVGK